MSRLIRHAFRGLCFLGIVMGIAACHVEGNVSGTDSDHSHLDLDEVTAEVRAAIVPSELVIGPNRFAVGLFDLEGNLINDAEVHFHYYDLSDPDNAWLESEATATRIQDRDGYTAIYTHNREFARAGHWGLEIDVYFSDGNTAKQRIGFLVEEDSPSLSAGEKAPAINTLTLDEVGRDLSRLTSAVNPNPALHEVSLAQAVNSNKPTVLLFATPAFCQTRFCGPSYEIVGDLEKIYRDRMNFVYVETFDGLPDPSAVNFRPSAAFEKFGLESEPILYLIDGEGTINYRLEGIFSAEEVEQLIQTRLDV